MKDIDIKNSRKKLGLTQPELAEALGFRGYQIICNIETGKTKPQKTTLLAIECLLRRALPMEFKGSNQ